MYITSINKSKNKQSEFVSFIYTENMKEFEGRIDVSLKISTSAPSIGIELYTFGKKLKSNCLPIYNLKTKQQLDF